MFSWHVDENAVSVLLISTFQVFALLNAL